MKNRIFTLILLLPLVLIVRCTKNANEGEKRVVPPNAQTFEMSPARGDTINKTDINGFKQGHWVYYKRPFDPDKTTTIVEEGDYINNRKQGIWIYYDSTGKVSRTVRFKDDIAR